MLCRGQVTEVKGRRKGAIKRDSILEARPVLGCASPESPTVHYRGGSRTLLLGYNYVTILSAEAIAGASRLWTSELLQVTGVTYAV